GPMTFARAYKLLKDKRNKDTEEPALRLKELNIKECTHCKNCSLVCPKLVMPEYLIKMEKDLLVEKGYIQQAGGFEFLS
ncbi:MAG: 4Fe-4S dicluster domain-containing protein, partial [Aquificaceae bacterium]